MHVSHYLMKASFSQSSYVQPMNVTFIICYQYGSVQEQQSQGSCGWNLSGRSRAPPHSTQV